jgi:hypothetical protein
MLSGDQVLAALGAIAETAESKGLGRALQIMDLAKTASEVGQALGRGDMKGAFGLGVGAAATAVVFGAPTVATAVGVTFATGNPVMGAAAATVVAVAAAPAAQAFGQAVSEAVTEGLNDH